jgi:hypothetical protein
VMILDAPCWVKIGGASGPRRCDGDEDGLVAARCGTKAGPVVSFKMKDRFRRVSLDVRCWPSSEGQAKPQNVLSVTDSSGPRVKVRYGS